MKNIILLFALIFTVGLGYAQNVKGNTVTTKEVPPVWPGCEDSKSTSTCFNQQLAKHIQKNFSFPDDYSSKDKGTKVIVSFIVNKKGEVEITDISGGRKALQEEARRNILAIPKMKPGQLEGKPRAISYKVPFNF